MIKLFSFMFFLTELGKSILWKCEPYKSKLDIIRQVDIWVSYWSKVFLSVFWVQILNKLHWHSSRRTAPHLNKYRSKATNNNFMKGYLFSHNVIVQCLLVRIPLVQTTEVVLLYVKRMESSSGFSKIANKEAILLVQNLRVRFLIIYYHFSL